MDDQQLDDSIKKKVARFEGEAYDPAAFSALRFRMESADLPFHVRYRTELMVGTALALATLIILLSQWLISDANAEALLDKMNAQEEKIDNLQQEIQLRKNLPPDTIHIIERDQDVNHYKYLLKRIAFLESELLNAINDRNSNSGLDENEIVKNVPEGNLAQPELNAFQSAPKNRRIGESVTKKSVRAEPRAFHSSEQTTQQLSAGTMRDMEKHYHPGIGIKAGPAFEINQGLIKEGKGNLNTTAGILADFILSPSLSLESGAKYGHRDYDYLQPNEKNISLPATDPSLGNLRKAEIDSWMIEVPVTLKYHYPFSLKTHGIAGLGYSSFIFREQVFDYSYEYAGNNDIFINALHESKSVKFYPATVNIALGLSRQIKDQRIEASVGYQKGIRPIGLEKTRADFFNVRTVFWFTIK